jgi:hypothetical protein
LRFLDGTEVTVKGLNEIMTDLYSEGRQANHDTAGAIVNRLQAGKNYIQASDLVLREYTHLH